jgi:integrase
MKQTNKLSDTVIRNAKPAAKPVRMFDGGGMYLEVSQAGGKLWRMQYRYGGKGKLLSFGAYPIVSLKDARERRDEAKKLLVNNVDPGEVKKAQKAAVKTACTNSFEAVALEWFEVWKVGRAESHTSKAMGRLTKDIFPWLGKRPVAEVTAPEVLAVLRRVESRGVIETAQRCKADISHVMRYAIATGRRVDLDPCPSLRGALKTAKGTNYAAITDPVKFGKLLRAIDAFQGTYAVRAALALAPLVFVRPGTLRAAKWADIDLEQAEWRFFSTKTKRDFIVPLSRQAVEIIRDLHPLTGGGEYLFPGRDPKNPISNATLNAAITRMGYDTKTDHTAHGFRASARTMLREQLDVHTEIIEMQLDHNVRDPLGTAYNRTQFLKERTAMMQTWDDYLSQLKEGAAVIQLQA